MEGCKFSMMYDNSILHCDLDDEIVYYRIFPIAGVK